MLSLKFILLTSVLIVDMLQKTSQSSLPLTNQNIIETKIQQLFNLIHLLLGVAESNRSHGEKLMLKKLAKAYVNLNKRLFDEYSNEKYWEVMREG